MDFPGNDYPNADNFPAASFPQGVTPPDVDPDTDNIIRVEYSRDWTAVLMSAVSQLLQYSTWEGTHDEKVMAVQRANLLKYQLQLPVTAGEPPFWDDPDGGDADDTDHLPDPEWYESLADWLVTAFIAVTFTPGAAIVYKTTIPRLRLAFRTGDAGAIVRVLIDSIEIWTGVTLTPLRDLLEVDLDLETFAALHSLTPPYEMRIEHAGAPEGVETAKLEVIRKRLRPEEYKMGCCDEPTGAEYAAHRSRAIAQQAQWFDVYDSSPTSIDSLAPSPNWNGGAFGADYRTELCAALFAWVVRLVWETYQTMLLAYGAASGALAVAWLAGLPGMLIGVTAAVIAGLSFNKVYAALNDTEALENIACQLNEALRGEATSQATLAAAIDGLSVGTDTEATIKGILQKFQVDGGGNYFSLLKAVADNRRQTAAGALADCPCDEECEFDWDLTIGIPPQVEIFYGEYVAGSGVVGEPQPGWSSQAQIYIRLDEQCLPDHITVEGVATSAIAHDFTWGIGQQVPPDSWEFAPSSPTDWTGSAGGAWAHTINTVPGVTPSFNFFYLRTRDNTAVRFTRVYFWND